MPVHPNSCVIVALWESGYIRTSRVGKEIILGSEEGCLIREELNSELEK